MSLPLQHQSFPALAQRGRKLSQPGSPEGRDALLLIYDEEQDGVK